MTQHQRHRRILLIGAAVIGGAILLLYFLHRQGALANNSAANGTPLIFQPITGGGSGGSGGSGRRHRMPPVPANTPGPMPPVGVRGGGPTGIGSPIPGGSGGGGIGGHPIPISSLPMRTYGG